MAAKKRASKRTPSKKPAARAAKRPARPSPKPEPKPEPRRRGANIAGAKLDPRSARAAADAASATAAFLPPHVPRRRPIDGAGDRDGPPRPAIALAAVYRDPSADLGARPGRPSLVDSPDAVTSFLLAVRGMASLEDAAAYAGYSERAVMYCLARGNRAARHARQRKAMPRREFRFLQFFQDTRQAIAFSKVALITRWHNASLKDWRAAARMLRIRFPEEWTEKGVDDAMPVDPPTFRVRRETEEERQHALDRRRKMLEDPDR